jgi:hypothetical protein
MHPRPAFAALLVAALAAAASTPSRADAWIVRLGTPRSSAGPVVADARGDVFAALQYELPHHSGGVSVLKLSRGDGRTLWKRALIGPGREHSDEVHQLLVASNGDVIAGGGVERNGSVDVFVTRLAGADGRPRWRRFVDGASDRDHYDEAQAMAMDASGDVIAVGSLEAATAPLYHSTLDLAVVKLDGRTGAERWRFVLDGSGHHADSAGAVAVDRAGDVLVGGYISEPGAAPGYYLAPSIVLKLAGRDGSLVWTRKFDAVWRLDSIAIDPAGDVVIAGTAYSSVGTGDDFAVAKLSGPTGAVVWEARTSGSTGRWQEAFDVAVLSGGDVAAVGFLADDADAKSLSIVRFDGASGAVRWRRDAQGSDGYGFGRAVVESAGESLLVGGDFRNLGSCYDVVALALDSANGTVTSEQAIDGTANASVCDIECEERPPCGPPRAGIDQDSLSGFTADRRGRPILAGAIYDGSRGRGRGFVARMR